MAGSPVYEKVTRDKLPQTVVGFKLFILIRDIRALDQIAASERYSITSRASFGGRISSLFATARLPVHTECESKFQFMEFLNSTVSATS